MIFVNVRNIQCFEKSRKHSFVEYSTIKKKNYAQGRRILVQAYKNAKMCVKERKKKKDKKRNVQEEESVDLAENREIVAFPLAASCSYLRAEQRTGGSRRQPNSAEGRAERERVAPRHSPKSASVTIRRAATVV